MQEIAPNVFIEHNSLGLVYRCNPRKSGAPF
jgi:hypothetical protein